LSGTPKALCDNLWAKLSWNTLGELLIWAEGTTEVEFTDHYECHYNMPNDWPQDIINHIISGTFHKIA
jgi:hypothetical protein